MHIVTLANETDFEGWRHAARVLLSQSVAPEYIQWNIGNQSHGLFDNPEYIVTSTQPSTPSINLPQASLQVTPASQYNVPRAFIDMCRKVILHSDPMRFALLYRLLWRLQVHPKLLQVSFDSDVAKAQAMIKAVRRDLHKMKAFVRFKEIVMQDGTSEFIAWFEPSHHIVEASSSFFTGRFTNMRWSILTPKVCMHWDGQQINYSAGANKRDAPSDDIGEDLWRVYYRNIFNPARLKVPAMLAQMPKKYWHNLPEAPLIAELIASASQRTVNMIAAQPTEPQRKVVKYLAKKEDKRAFTQSKQMTNALHEVNQTMLHSYNYPLAVHATQAVLGVGPLLSSVMIIGDQPEEQDDLAGQPLLGPAGQWLNQALQAANLKRSEIYLTHVLKHFKFKLQGRRRVGLMANMADIKPYVPWLLAEIAIIKPRLIVAFGELVARALVGESLNVAIGSGRILKYQDAQLLLIDHPVLMMATKDKAIGQQCYESFVRDLTLAVAYVKAHVQAGV